MDIINSGRHEFGNEKETRSYTRELDFDVELFLKKLRITDTDLEKIANDIKHKFSYNSGEKFVICVLSFAAIYKFCPDAYRLLMQTDFKVSFNSDPSKWTDICKEGHLYKPETEGFFDVQNKPPLIYVNLNKDSYHDPVVVLIHELMHATSRFTALYYNKNFCVFYNNSDYYENKYSFLADVVNEHEKINFGKRFPPLDDCLVTYNNRYNYADGLLKTNTDAKKNDEIIDKYGLWGFYINQECKYSDPEELLTDALSICAVPEGKELLKKFDPELYDIIEKHVKPLIKEANIGITRQNLYKKRGERAEYH